MPFHGYPGVETPPLENPAANQRSLKGRLHRIEEPLSSNRIGESKMSGIAAGKGLQISRFSSEESSADVYVPTQTSYGSREGWAWGAEGVEMPRGGSSVEVTEET
ncbi:hypothetical protein KM043_005951 [Ampulex compressa]|nr:hypothetical protein KM043_005951 [Ampulex compressa]